MEKNNLTGGFTLPGEAGYEALTLEMAKKWGADVIRDSDGTKLSPKILESGYGIYSTICIIREHNEWAREHMDTLQQTFLVTQPEVAREECLTIPLLAGFFEEQFAVNETEESQRYWQVYDRTCNREVPGEQWSYNQETQEVTIRGICPWHKYTVSFLAYRIWEEISMYNHTINHWEKEHLMQLDPRHESVREYLLFWMEQWLKEHPATTVVRFTSLFYNFVWIWGRKAENRHLFTDWASYDFTVSPRALGEFQERYGYALTAEDFVNQGKYHVTHMPGDAKKKDWMEFINDFVISFGRQLVDLVHRYGKQAYVFYDDSWVGLEPYNDRFEEFGFDGIIKCVFSGYEARLCSGVKTRVHELRMHPYLFPTGVDGSPTFLEGGNPKGEAQKYWQAVRRAILREPVDRIGLGGYLHLVEGAPEFVEYMAEVAEEFRRIRGLHESGKPYTCRPRVGVLHAWGKLRSWTLSGHFHETYMHDLIHINESLSGLPFAVRFLDFTDAVSGALEELDVVINAGYAGSAWSGGSAWEQEEVIEALTRWTHQGGVLIGVNEPSALPGYDTFFRMSHVLGVDRDTGERVCHGKWQYTPVSIPGLLPPGSYVKEKSHIYLTDPDTQVLLEKEGTPVLTLHRFGEGMGIYLGGYELSLENTRLLSNLILYGAGEGLDQMYQTDNLMTECAYYPEAGTLVVINNSPREQSVKVTTEGGLVTADLKPYETRLMEI